MPSPNLTQVRVDRMLMREVDHLRIECGMDRPQILAVLIRRGMPASAEELLAEAGASAANTGRS